MRVISVNRRDLLLQQMGIEQWQLYRPEVLKGAVNIAVPSHIRLVVIAEKPLEQRDGLLHDVLLSAEITSDDCLLLDFEQALHLNVQHPINYWLLGKNSEKIDRTLPLCTHAISLWQTHELNALKQNPQAKRALWQQIQTSFKS